ncbi:MAG: hypothetical protein MJ211_10095 [Bacteroidales bacterium]|nr:hypothetical protein [Bacteroidales bacterium]
MEIKAFLDKTYSEEEKINFIIEQNHRLGYEIRETETRLEAWGYTEEEIAQQEQEHIKTLTCTKRVFALMLQELGVDYLTQLKPLIESNPQAQLEWDLCVELSRNNPLLDVMASKLGISSEKLDKLFQYANGEITLEVFKGE